MSNYTLTPEEEACVKICDAVKRIWNGPAGALKMGLEGPEIQDAILKVLYDLTGKEEVETMSTAFYKHTTEKLIGVRTFEKAGADKPRQVFRWAMNPVDYLRDDMTPIRDEYGTIFQREAFVLGILVPCEVQIYDLQNIPAE